MTPYKQDNSLGVAVIGGGAAGFFGGIAAAQKLNGPSVAIFEKGAQFLSKVRISGGGRCNVTHHLFDMRDFATRYPRGERALIGAFRRFAVDDTIQWFESRGVKLKAEADGRMFPVTDRSDTVIDCLMREARASGVELQSNCGIAEVEKLDCGFRLRAENGKIIECQKLLLAMGGCRTLGMCAIPQSLGHSIAAPVPSLFSFNIASPWLRELSGISLASVAAEVVGTDLSERGPILITHAGLSGPVILRLSAWGARKLHDLNYKFELRMNWAPQLSEEQIRKELQRRSQNSPAKAVANWSLDLIPARLWRALVLACGLTETTRYAELGRAALHDLVTQIRDCRFLVNGKALNKDEFVTCGGIKLNEVNFKTMESRLSPGLYFAGEMLDIDGITGGFNFQAAWTSGWIAGNAIADALGA